MGRRNDRRKSSGAPKRLVPLVCRVKDRHPVHSEPTLLEVIGVDQVVDLADGNQFVILFTEPEGPFQLSCKSPNAADPRT